MRNDRWSYQRYCTAIGRKKKEKNLSFWVQEGSHGAPLLDKCAYCCDCCWSVGVWLFKLNVLNKSLSFKVFPEKRWSTSESRENASEDEEDDDNIGGATA